MANYPTFNPNSYFRYSQAELRNRAVADSFEPGSTFKVFLIAAALEERLVRPTDAFNCENGSYTIATHTVHDTHSYGSPVGIGYPQIFQQYRSCQDRLQAGQRPALRYLRNFGFGERSGIDLPGESPGNMRSKQRWYGIDLATISFGQGISASSIQLATAISVVANGGNLMKP